MGERPKEKQLCKQQGEGGELSALRVAERGKGEQISINNKGGGREMISTETKGEREAIPPFSRRSGVKFTITIEEKLFPLVDPLKHQ